MLYSLKIPLLICVGFVNWKIHDDVQFYVLKRTDNHILKSYNLLEMSLNISISCRLTCFVMINRCYHLHLFISYVLRNDTHTSFLFLYFFLEKMGKDQKRAYQIICKSKTIVNHINNKFLF